jgi:hypothetical protein
MTTATPPLGDLLDHSGYGNLDIHEIDQSRLPEVECLCPFCGAFNTGVGRPCGHCALEDTNATRAATTQRVGPWFVLQTRNPSAPGMNFETLQSLIRRHAVVSRSVVRGPTTGQLWRLASKVRGLSREFGQCYDCGEDIERDEEVCPHCDRLQSLPDTAEARGEIAEVAKPTVVIDEAELVAAPIVDAVATPIAEPVEVAVEPVAAAPEVEAPAETTAAEKAILAEDLEPITVMSSESIDASPAHEVKADRAADRHIPKDDLLTARDVAKAFLLEFGPTAVPAPKRVTPRSSLRDYRKLKTGLSLVGVLLLTAGIWPVGHVLAGWFESGHNSVPMPQPTPVAPANTAVADAHLAGDLIAPISPPSDSTPTPTDLQCTAGQLDVAITGEGFFQVKLATVVGDGTGYTRDGLLSRDGDGDLIVNAGSGYRLIPPINIPADAGDVSIAPDGVVRYTISGTSVKQIAGQIQLARFNNPRGLKQVSGSICTETNASGLAELEFPGTHSTGALKQGYVDAIATNADVHPLVEVADAPAQPPVTLQPIEYVNKPPVSISARTPARAATPSATASQSDDPAALLSAGMDCESRGDYATALADYERIESLPSNEWPQSLELRVKLARKEVKGQLR